MKTALWVEGNSETSLLEIAESISGFVKMKILSMDLNDFVMDKDGQLPKRGTFLKVSKGTKWPEGNFYVKASECEEPEDFLLQFKQLKEENERLVKRAFNVAVAGYEPFDFDSAFQFECEKLGIEPDVCRANQPDHKE